MMRSIKAVPIRMSPPEIYESMSRGTLDGAMLGYQSAVSYDLIGLLKTGTLNEPLSSVVITYSISTAKWKTLPEPVRTVLAEEGERITRESCAKFAQAEEQALAKARDKGIKLIHFSPEDEKTMEYGVRNRQPGLGGRTGWPRQARQRGPEGLESGAEGGARGSLTIGFQIRRAT